MAALFEIYKDKKGQFRFRLKAPNGQTILAGSQGYARLAGCLKGVDAVKNNSELGERFERTKTRAGKHRFRLLARNKQVIGASESYSSAQACANGVRSVRRNAPIAAVYDRSADKNISIKLPETAVAATVELNKNFAVTDNLFECFIETEADSSNPANQFVSATLVKSDEPDRTGPVTCQPTADGAKAQGLLIRVPVSGKAMKQGAKVTVSVFQAGAKVYRQPRKWFGG